MGTPGRLVGLKLEVVVELGDPRKARVVELRFVGRLSVGEAAEVLEISEETLRGTGKWPEPGFSAGLSERDTRS